ncbi:dihydrofolate reductase family protein [Amycolatopsis nigrescens]|uniref:dihydrofolate reductase family protein n=1 Tax=Amycolatopsis nigrescens TaxID=381445 RepID=UPI00037601ED|nr:dihydrofolate reductase family protein [Amycolatopsis nigrescens]
MRKLTYYIAISIDGFIAGPDGDIGFYLLEGDHSAAMTERYPETVPTGWREAAGITGANREFDTVLMGRGTYEFGLRDGRPSPYAHLRQYVFSSTLNETDLPADAGIELVTGDPVAKVRELKRSAGGGIWLCGGGGLAGALREEIDELVVKIHPVVAGAGIPMFGGGFRPERYTVTDSRVFDSGVAVLTYTRPLPTS